MFSLESFKIDLKGMEKDEQTLTFDITDAFFEAIKAPAVQHGHLTTTLTIRRLGESFDLLFHTEGSVIVACDLCLDDMDQPILTDDHLVAQFGDAYAEDDDTVTIPENEGVLDVSWFIYEFIELNIPLRHVHAPGKCNPAMMNILKEHSAARSGDGDGEHETDSRWSALKDLHLDN